MYKNQENQKSLNKKTSLKPMTTQTDTKKEIQVYKYNVYEQEQ